MTTITLSGDLKAGTYTLAPVTVTPPAPLWATMFLPPAALASIVNEMQPINGVPALPWGSPALAIQCLGPPGEHQHAIVPVPSTGGAALKLRMTAGGGSDQAALLVQPTQSVKEFHYRARIMLDPLLGKILTPSANWTVVSEWKTGGQGAAYGGDLRCKLEINMDAGKVLHWRMIIDTNANDPSVPLRTLYDSAYNATAPVASGQWATIEHYCKRSAGNDGLIWWRVGGQEIGRFAGPNYGAKGAELNRIFLTNLYGAAYPQERWITDIEIRNALP